MAAIDSSFSSILEIDVSSGSLFSLYLMSGVNMSSVYSSLRVPLLASLFELELADKEFRFRNDLRLGNRLAEVAVAGGVDTFVSVSTFALIGDDSRLATRLDVDEDVMVVSVFFGSWSLSDEDEEDSTTLSCFLGD